MEQSLMGIIVQRNTCTTDKDKLELWDEIRQRGFKDILKFRMLFVIIRRKSTALQDITRWVSLPSIRWFWTEKWTPSSGETDCLYTNIKSTIEMWKCGVFEETHIHAHTHTNPLICQVGSSPWGNILADSPVPLFPLLFLCEEPVLFEYNGGSGKSQQLSDRHSIIVTESGVTTNGTSAHCQLAPSWCLLTAFICGCRYAADCVYGCRFPEQMFLEMVSSYSIFQQQHIKCWN